MGINSITLLDIKPSTASFSSDYDIQKIPGGKDFSNAYQQAKDQQTRTNTTYDQPSRAREIEQNGRQSAVNQVRHDQQKDQEKENVSQDTQAPTKASGQSSASGSTKEDKNDVKSSDAKVGEGVNENSDEDTEHAGKLLPKVIGENGKTLQLEGDKEVKNVVDSTLSTVVTTEANAKKTKETGLKDGNALLDNTETETAASELSPQISLVGDQVKTETAQHKKDKKSENNDESVEILQNNQDPLLLSENFDDVNKKDTGNYILDEKGKGNNDQKMNIENEPLLVGQQNLNVTSEAGTTDQPKNITVNGVAEDDKKFKSFYSVLNPSGSEDNKESGDIKIKDKQSHSIVGEVKNNEIINTESQNNEKNINANNEESINLDKKNEQILNSMDKSSSEEQVSVTARNNVVKQTSELSRAISAAKQPLRETIELPVGHKNWGDALAEKTMLLVSQNGSSARLNLIPHNLGPLEIKLQMQGDASSIEFVAHHAHTKDAIETAIPKLREMFETGGLSLGDVNVRDQSKNSKGNESYAYFSKSDDKENMIPSTISSELMTSVRSGRVDYIV